MSDTSHYTIGRFCPQIKIDVSSFYVVHQINGNQMARYEFIWVNVCEWVQCLYVLSLYMCMCESSTWLKLKPPLVKESSVKCRKRSMMGALMAELQGRPRQDKLCIWRMLNEIWGASWWLFELWHTAWTPDSVTLSQASDLFCTSTLHKTVISATLTNKKQTHSEHKDAYGDTSVRCPVPCR